MDIPLALPADDARCANILLETITTQPGIRGAGFDSSRSTLTIQYDPGQTSLSQAEAVADEMGIALGRQLQSCSLNVGGLRCDECALRLERGLAALPGVVRASVNPAAGRLGVEYVADEVTTAQIERRVTDMGYRVPKADEAQSFWDRHHLAVMTVLAGVFLALGFVAGAVGAPPIAAVALFALSYLFGGLFAARKGMQSLLTLSLDVDFLMVAAAIGAASIGHWEEGAILLFLFSLGTALEHYALDRTRNSIRALMDLSPRQATVVRSVEGVRHETIVPVEDLLVGDMILVRPGEKVAADGQIVSGQSAVDQAAITGESIPVDKVVGDNVFAGTLNGAGALEVRVVKRAQDTTLAKIVQMVEEARSEKSPTQRFIESFEEKYAWGVVITTLLLIIIPTLLGEDFSTSFYRAMTLLVVASPCALVISTPASVLSAIANGARSGILFKGGAHLENVGHVKVVAFDKTGTLTHGKPRVTDVRSLAGERADEMLAAAAAVERLSEHPIATAVVAAAEERGLAMATARDGQSTVGQGIHAILDGQTVWVGKPSLAASQGVALDDAVLAQVAELESQGKTAMVVGTDRPLGIIAVADTIRPTSLDAVAALKKLGVERVVMLTGDNQRAAQTIGHQAGVDEVYADLLPADKVRKVKDLEAQYGSVAVVGDGVNDAPALAAASVGIAMGAAGSDVALETADVVLMADDLMKIPYAIGLGRQATRVVKQNLSFALSVIAVLIVATLLGVVGLPLGVIGHEGSTVLVVLNGLRLLSFKPNV